MEANMSKAHAYASYAKQLADLQLQVTSMGALVEEQLSKAITSVLQQNEQLADEAVKMDAAVDQYELDIDRECALLIIKRQPTAGDLRAVIASSKIVLDLERIGDKCRKIARLGKRVTLIDRDDEYWKQHIHALGEEVMVLLARTLKNFVERYEDEAIDIMRAAKKLVRHARSLAEDVLKQMAEDPERMEQRLHMLNIGRAIDRIADHAANIAGHVIYMQFGMDVRHRSIAEIEQELGESNLD